MNGILIDELTGLDNDTRDYDSFRLGVTYTNSTTFGGSFLFKAVKVGSADPPAGWTATGDVTYGGDPYNGEQCIRLISDGATQAKLEQSIAVEPGTDYTVSVYCLGDYEIDFDGTIEDGNAASWAEKTVSITTGDVTSVTLKLTTDGLNKVCHFDSVVVSQDNGYSRTKFNGYIRKITPSAGQFNKPQTLIECVDWIYFLTNTEVGIQAITASQRADQGLTTLLTEFDRQPIAVDFDTGDEIFAYIFKGISSVSSMARAFHQLIWNENGRLYCKGNGTLVFENASHRAGITESAFNLEDNMQGLQVEYNARNIRNIVTLEVSNTRIDASATTVLWEVEDAISIPAGEAVTLKFGYSDPETGNRISATEVVEPSGSDLVKGANITVSGWSAGQDSAEATFTNSGGSAEEVTTFNIKGKGIYEYDTITVTKKDLDSIWQVGEQKFIRRLNLISAPATADTRAQDIIDKYAASHIGRCRVMVCANQDLSLAKNLIEAETSTRFTITETATGIDKDFFVDRIAYRQINTLLWVTIEAQAA